MRLGFVGCGNMAAAIIGGILEKGIVKKEDIKASTKTEASAAKVRENLDIACGIDNREAIRDADVVFLAVKPQFCEGVIKEIREEIKENQVILSIVAGKKLEWLEAQFGKKCKIIRTMPNTPALVGEGITGVCPNDQVTEKEVKEALVLLRSFGRADTVTETILDVVGAVSGSSPAFVFLFIEAMADGAVAEGMPRKQAYEFAAQAVYGSAKMVLETGMHPGELKDMVCSPAGTTIEGIGVLEERGMRSAVMESVRACVKKTRQL